MKKPSVHVMEGVDRLEKGPAADTLFESGAEADARAQVHHQLQYFPTPPWAVRAMVEAMGDRLDRRFPVYEPCAGRGHIVVPLRQAGFGVIASDIHDHGVGFDLGDARALAARPEGICAMVTNPPFDQAEDIVRQAQMTCRHVVVLCRLSFLSSAGRHSLHFANALGNLRTFLPCIERVPMVLGRYDPQASTATEFAWFHYEMGYAGRPELVPIPPGSRDRHVRKDDVRI